MNESQAAILKRTLSTEFYLSPLKFALWAYDWGKGDLKHFRGPRKWQREVMLEIEQYLREALFTQSLTNSLPDFFRSAIASGRGPGKSALVGMISHWMMSTRIGSSTWVAANGEPQLRTKTFPEIAKWVARGVNSEFFEVNSTTILPAKWFKDYIEMPEASGGLGKSTRYYYISGQLWSNENPDAFAGAHNYDGECSIFDEASGIPDPIWTVQEGVFTENIPDRFWFTFSNPRRNEGAFFDCFHKNKHLWRTRQIDSRTVEGISTTSFDNIIDRFGADSDEARVEVYGQFPSVGDNQFISPQLVDEAISREHEPIPKSTAATASKIVLGVDIARFGSDSSIIAVRRNNSLVKIIRYNGLDTMAMTGKVIEAMREWKPDLTILDEGGLGAGVLDRLVEQNYNVRGVQFGSRADNPLAYFNKRAEMWGNLREWLRTAAIGSMEANSVRENKIIKTDLTAPRYKISSNGSIQLESKQDMKKRGYASTDVSDALALTLSFPVGDAILPIKRLMIYQASKPTPQLIHVVQSYVGAYTDKTADRPSAGTVWGVFEQSSERCVILLDSWCEKLRYPEMREKIIKDWHAEYGGSTTNHQIRTHKPTVVLVGHDAGTPFINDLRAANIIVPNYAAGDIDLIERAHQTATIMENCAIYIPESSTRKKLPVTWGRMLIDQCERYPNDEATEVLGSFTRAMMYLRDNGYLETPVADLDDTPYETDYSSKQTAYNNPYAA